MELLYDHMTTIVKQHQPHGSIKLIMTYPMHACL